MPSAPDRIHVEQLHEFEHYLDVRTPTEFALDHVPDATNCPVLNDDERARVGTVYKQQSAFVAKKMGAALVARNIATHLETRFLDMARDWRPLVYCWRGGKRSAAMTHILREIGWDARQLEGGYKAFRRHVVADIPARVQGLRLRVLCGLTGAGKSRLLRALDALGEQVLDLEALAHHRGSVLGGEPRREQPTQKYFESCLWHRLGQFDSGRPVYVESESKKVGNLRVPDALITAMWRADCVWLTTAAEMRLTFLKEEYAHFMQDPESLVEKLECLRALHGAKVIERWSGQVRARDYDALVLELLECHYDPAYLKSIHSHYQGLAQATHCELVGHDAEAFEALAQALRCNNR